MSNNPCCRWCGRQDSLAICNECKKSVCPSCRCGTGSIADGYECVHNCVTKRWIREQGVKTTCIKRPFSLDFIMVMLCCSIIGSFLGLLMAAAFINTR